MTANAQTLTESVTASTMMSMTPPPTSKYRITREAWDEDRSKRAAFMSTLQRLSRDESCSSVERIAACCVWHAVSELWYGYYPSEAHYKETRSQARRAKTLYEIEHGGLDMWLSVLALPVDYTVSRIIALNPETVLPKRVDNRGKYDRTKQHKLTQ